MNQTALAFTPLGILALQEGCLLRDTHLIPLLNFDLCLPESLSLFGEEQKIYCANMSKRNTPILN